MTHTRSRRHTSFDQTGRPARERRKAVLTCPRCGHASPPDGDWIWRDCPCGSELRCPDCETAVTVRPASPASDTPK